MFSLFSQIAKYHRDFNFEPYMKHTYKVIYMYIKGQLSSVDNKLADVIQGTLHKNMVRFMIHALKPLALDKPGTSSGFFQIKRLFVFIKDLYHC